MTEHVNGSGCSRCGKPLVHGVLVVSEDGQQGAMVGRECLNHVGKGRPPMTVQTLIFPKARFGKAKAAAEWATAHGFSASKIDETAESFRLRQVAPKKFDADTFRTIRFGSSGILAVVARNKRTDGAEVEADASNRAASWFLVDKVTRTVRRSSEQERDAPPRYVKVLADGPTEAVREAQSRGGPRCA